MTSRSYKDPPISGRNFPVTSQHRRGRSLTGISKDTTTDENLELFSRNRRSLSVASSDESDASVKLGRISVGSTKLSRSGIDDLLTSTDGGKHDYDWLLTPPGTPLFPPSDGSEAQSTVSAPKSNSLMRSVSTTKASRLSATQSESNHPGRPTRSSSVTRPSVSTTHYSTYSSNKSSSILNTSSASVTSHIRQATPVARSPSAARPSTPSPCTPSRPSTPSRARPSPATSSLEKSRTQQSSRPSTPTSRPQIQPTLSSPAARSNSRPSTPTRRSPAPSLSQSGVSTMTVGRVLANGRSGGLVSRPSSPGPRIRPPPQPIVLPDFPLETPPNLRTTLPDRPVSAGRSRPGVAVTMKGSIETPSIVSAPRRHSSPIVTRGRLMEPSAKGRVHVNGHAPDSSEPRKASQVSELGSRKPTKPSAAATESTGFGRTISRKSLDVAIRHMDIRSSMGGIRPLPGTTLFPQSIRSAAPRTQSVRALSASASVNLNGSLPDKDNDAILENGNHLIRSPDKGREENGRLSAKVSDHIYESSRYDAILLKEDLENTNWLHSLDDKSDQGIIFDNGFDHLPDSFALL
ncbi:hypothetical protein RJ641_028667 [Dillenia turbinata]|uniref:Uncharacterized protein n=1 Tax=Dillenia turbinata TaxID=194707 RepID=A0AAN8ZRU1_9MAGN